MDTKTLLINADDLGYTQGINEAVFRCHREGVLRSATIMACGKAFEDAVTRAKCHPQLGIGVHLALTELPSAAPPEAIPDLVDETGNLPPSPAALLKGLFSGRVSAASVKKELHCQLTRVLDSGIRPTHLDTHKHVHLIPQVLEATIEVARKFKIFWMRNPFDCSPFWAATRNIARNQWGEFLGQHTMAWLAKSQRKAFQRKIHRAGLKTPKNFLGISLTGLWNPSLAMCFARRLPQGITEWMMHPGDYDSDLQGSRTRLLKQRQVERDLLLSPLFKEALLEQNIQIKHFGEMSAC